MGTPRERIQKLILTGDNRLKQGVDPAKVRASYERGALARAGGGARGAGAAADRAQARRSRAARSENRLHPLRLTPDVVLRGRSAGGLVRARERRRRLAAPRASPATSSGSTRMPASGGTNSGGPPTRSRRPCGRRPSPRGSTGRTARAARARTRRRRAARQRRHRVVRDAADRRARARGPRAAARSGPSPTNVRLPRPSARERVGEPDDVLPLGEAPTQTNAGRPRRGARLDRGSARGRRPSRSRSVLPRASGSFARARGAGSRRRRSPLLARRTTRRVSAGDARHGADVADVAAVRGDDERRARRDAAIRPRRDEEVRPDDVRAARPAPARRRRARASGACRRRAVEHRELDLVPALARAPARAARRTRRDRGRPAPGTSARRAGSAPPRTLPPASQFRNGAWHRKSGLGAGQLPASQRFMPGTGTWPLGTWPGP